MLHTVYLFSLNPAKFRRYSKDPNSRIDKMYKQTFRKKKKKADQNYCPLKSIDQHGFPANGFTPNIKKRR